MYAMNRVNNLGQPYMLTELPSGGTRIVTGDKVLIVKHDIHEISQAWYNWQVRGEKIQVAFMFFTNAEREFIKTGITEEEWNRIFSKDYCPLCGADDPNDCDCLPEEEN